MCETWSCENRCNEIKKSQCPIVDTTLSRIANQINKKLSPHTDTIATIDSEPLLDALSNKSRTWRAQEVEERFRDKVKK